MDTRENQNERFEKARQEVETLQSNQQVLQVDQFKLNNAYKNAMINNLVTKIDTKAVMEKVYLKELEYLDSFPQELKYYVHFPYILHASVVVMFLLRYKKQLTSVSALGVICAATAINEFGRYERVKACNNTNWPKYVEARDNYEKLIGKTVENGSIGISDIFKYYFRVDINSSYKRIKHLFYDDLLNDDIITGTFF